MTLPRFEPRWRDDPLRWEISSGTILNILDNASKDTSMVERDNGLFPSEIVSELVRMAKKYSSVENTEIALDASYIIQTVPDAMTLITRLGSGSSNNGRLGKSTITRGLLTFGVDGRVRLTDDGREELSRIYAEFSKRVGVDIERKHVDLNEPLLKWSPPGGWGVSKEDNESLPPKRETRARLTYRQWLTMMYKESKIYVHAQEDSMSKKPVDPDSHESKMREEGLRRRYKQIKNVRMFAKLVLGGGPESVWMGKPLVPKDVHNDVESFYASGKAGFNPKIVEASSIAWELWETDQVSLNEYAAVKDWCGIRAVEEMRFKPDDSGFPDTQFDSELRPKAYSRYANRHSTDSEKALTKYEPLGVNQPMTSAYSRAADQIVSPENFGHINPDGTIARTRCGFIYGRNDDSKNPGYVTFSVKEGSRCPNIAVTGTTRCEMHGGLMVSPAETRAMIVATQMQTFALAGQAIATIADVMINGQTESARLRAAETILNRSGIVEGAEVDVRDARKEADAVGVSARDVVMERLKKLSQYESQEQSRQRQAEIEMQQNVIDVDIVTNDDKSEETA